MQGARGPVTASVPGLHSSAMGPGSSAPESPSEMPARSPSEATEAAGREVHMKGFGRNMFGDVYIHNYSSN